MAAGFRNQLALYADEGRPDDDAAPADQIRDEVGPGVGIRVDPNEGWSLFDARRALRELEEVGLDPEQTIAEFITRFPDETVTQGHPRTRAIVDELENDRDRRPWSGLAWGALSVVAAVVPVGSVAAPAPPAPRDPRARGTGGGFSLARPASTITLREVVEDLGGGTASGRQVRAVQVGGPLGAYAERRVISAAVPVKKASSAM